MSPLSQAEDRRSEVLTRRKALQLLEADSTNPFIRSEEQRHPWSVDPIQTLHCPLLHGPLLRVWDSKSGRQPEGDNRMLSRSPDQRLDTEQARKTSLVIHLDHKVRESTPYISFTKSPSAIEEIVAWRSTKRGAQTLTVIDPNVRLNNGLPIVDVVAEMQHYGIQDPYNKGNRYYIDHYVCLWEVTKEEIVDHYEWEELAKRAKWYEEIIMPDFRRFSRRNVLAPTRTSASNMSTMIESLPSKSLSYTGSYMQS
ncbi:hypothetical protein M011DRAFT_318375 [Sporormia fimetaria CBS 119925]|uniref:DUF7587 domain-containing protein n=1 Tax=Sporormia fimetaria CBS 119925 TaxID=1340428 RepID=A0A6A6UW81_9PLEO|nr:hypothetical protein M011DRAFT_434294 [Sporormia fimetaria CBS 119925]KAF2741736.1 hypothetical protein M011DRAFT_318375 [Sporormia fimetaria CBS 119925]